MKRSFMKRSFGVLLGIAVVLACVISFTHRAGDPPASNMRSASVPQPTLGAEAPVLHASSDEAPVPSAAVAGIDKTANTQHKDMVALRKEVALLRREVSAVQRQIHEQRQAATVVALEREEDPAKDPRTELATRAAAERVRQQQMAVLEANFRHEPTDSRWSSEAVGAVQAALASDDTVQNLLLDLDCRSHTCRVELAEDDTGELAKVLPLILQQLAQTLPNGTASYVDAGDGSKAMILYLSHESDEPPPISK